MIIKRPSYLPDPLPLGYRLRTTRRGTVLDADLDLLGRIYDAFALVADGRKSLVWIASTLAEDGLRTRSGRPFSTRRLRSLLRNPFYAGRIVRDGTLVPTGHTGIIDLATYGYVQRQPGPESA